MVELIGCTLLKDVIKSYSTERLVPSNTMMGCMECMQYCNMDMNLKSTIQCP